MPVIRRKVTVEVVDHEETGARVRTARKKAGLSLQQVGSATGFSATYLSNLETGHRPWTDHLYDTIMAAIRELG